MRTVLSILALLTVGVPSWGQQSGLLLSLRVPSCSESDSNCKAGLQTLWIAPQNGSIQLVAVLPDLIVPRNDGFWRVGVRNFCEPRDWSVDSQDVFFALPVSQRPAVKEGLVPCDQAKKIAVEKYTELLSKPNKTQQDKDIVAESEVRGPEEVCSSYTITVEFVNATYVSTSGGDNWSVIDKSAPVDFKWLRSWAPAARDAFWSPRKDLLVVLTNADSLLVFRPTAQKLGAPVLTLPLTQWELPVMAE
jgi:hypothetical protein